MNLRHTLTNTITVASITGVTSTGKSTFGAQRTIKARVERMSRLLKGARGEERVTSHRVFTDVELKPTDRIWLPGEDTTSPDASRVPVAVSSSSTFSGQTTLWEVDL